MKKPAGLLIPLLTVFFMPSKSQSIAWQRANTLGMGMNLSWLENYGSGTPSKDYADYLDLSSIITKKEGIRLMHELGFRTLRLPVSFDHWTSRQPPYAITSVQNFAAIDSILKWTHQYHMKLIIDDHHGSLDGPNNAYDELPRLIAIWQQVATRYRHTNPNEVFFELYNEPHAMADSTWKHCAIALIKAVRKIVPYHTLIVGGEDWNNIDGLLKMGRLNDPNIIYTFHFYEPFLFTHQGAPWAGKEATSNIRIPFPFDSATMPPINPLSKGTYGEKNYETYSTKSSEAWLSSQIKQAADFSHTYHVPVFCGEWGSFDKYPDSTSRFRYTATIHHILVKYKLPFAYWEWDGSFSLFNGTPSPSDLPEGMLKAFGLRSGSYK